MMGTKRDPIPAAKNIARFTLTDSIIAGSPFDNSFSPYIVILLYQSLDVRI